MKSGSATSILRQGALLRLFVTKTGCPVWTDSRASVSHRENFKSVTSASYQTFQDNRPALTDNVSFNSCQQPNLMNQGMHDLLEHSGQRCLPASWPRTMGSLHLHVLCHSCAGALYSIRALSGHVLQRNAIALSATTRLSG